MLNDYLQRVQIGRHKEVPFEELTSIWFVWYRQDGTWDSATMTQWPQILEILKSSDNKVKDIFAVWHGNHRTNLFLMDKEDMIKRLEKGNTPR